MAVVSGEKLTLYLCFSVPGVLENTPKAALLDWVRDNVSNDIQDFSNKRYVFTMTNSH